MSSYRKIMIKVTESKSESSIVNHLCRTLIPNQRRLSTTVSLLHKWDFPLLIKGHVLVVSSIILRIPTDCELPFLNITGNDSLETHALAMRIKSFMITDEYDIDKTIAEGYFAKIFLTNHKPTKSCVVLKACHMELTNVKEFIREFHYNYQLSHHPQILSCYQVNSCWSICCATLF